MSLASVQAPSRTSGDASLDLVALDAELHALSAEERVAWTLARYRGHIALSSSFGTQAAVMLHMATAQAPNIPVIVVDTGYFFPETYQFIDLLQKRLDLNLKVYRNPLSPAWQEARHGRLWEGGVEGIEKYNEMNKVEPLNRALQELNIRAWLSGVRRQQSSTRQNWGVLALKEGRVKVHPIIDWTDRDVFLYLKKHDLPYHPLWDQGYVSVGDTHTTRQMADGMTEEETRFFGLKRECGIHENSASDGKLPEYSI